MIYRLMTGTIFAFVLSCLTSTVGTERLESLRVLQEDYPRVFFFRQTEHYLAAGKNVSYEQWEKTFERLMGIQGKVLDEEIHGRSVRHIDFFMRFKKRHPDQLILLHYNGNARDPRYQTEKYFAGHWLYCNGAKILRDVSAEEGETDICVDNPRLFKVNVGRYRNTPRRENDDIGLCMLDADGKPDWHCAEQVKLVSVDVENNVIRVKRGCYGTRPRAFPAGCSYAAAHMTEGPWGNKKSTLMWYYNHSTCCPRDEKGRSCTDIHCEELASRFLSGGELAAFDGLEFDVLWHRCGGIHKGRGADCDADGKADAGIFDGVNTYGIGVIEFCQQLREQLGNDRIIQADGMAVNNQRAFGVLNGIESEGWPHLRDREIRDWSGGLNRHFFWNRNAHPPVFNYINHRFALDKPGVKNPEIPFNIHRLVFAAGVFTNSAITQLLTPKNDPDGLPGIWDEFRAGTKNRLGWLGKPLGPAVHMAIRQPDMLDGKGTPIGPDLLKRLSGAGSQFAVEEQALKATAVDPKAREIRFRLCDVPCDGPDLFVRLTARGLPMRGYPSEMARLMWVRVAPESGRKKMSLLPGNAFGKQFMTWVNEKDFTSGFCFPKVKSPTVNLEFLIEGAEPVWISDISIHAHPDAIYREFEHGLVLANPSPRRYVFDLDQLVPGRKLRRLKGTPNQDIIVNNGSPVAGRLTLQPQDGLFLIDR